MATKSRGPSMIPRSTARFRSTSAKPAPSLPMSRSVVKPCSSAIFIARVARSVRYGSDSPSSCASYSTEVASPCSSTCVCTSIRPGISVWPERSTSCRSGRHARADLADAAVLDHHHDVLAHLLGGDVEQAPGADRGDGGRGLGGEGGSESESDRAASGSARRMAWTSWGLRPRILCHPGASPRCRAGVPTPYQGLQAVHVEIDDRRRVQREQLADDEAADDRDSRAAGGAPSRSPCRGPAATPPAAPPTSSS